MSLVIPNPNRHKEIISILESYVKQSELRNNAFVFGGYLRDCLTNNFPNDLDLILTVPFEVGWKFAVDLAKFTGDYSETNPKDLIGAIRLRIFGQTSNEMWIDMTPYTGDGTGIPVESLIHSSFYHRDFAVNALYQDLTEGTIIDPCHISMKCFVEKNLKTVTEDYDSIFWGFPVRLYRMFRIQSSTGFSIPESQVQYAKNYSWLGSFIERERIIIEMSRMKTGKYAEMALTNLRRAHLDPSDLSRADLYLGSGWYECEPGTEPNRVKDEPHMRWAGSKPEIHLNSSIDSVEIVYSTPLDTDEKFVSVIANGSVEKMKMGKDLLVIKPRQSKTITFEFPTFRPCDIMNTTDDRNLSIYVSKFVIHQGGERKEIPMRHVPYYIEI